MRISRRAFARALSLGPMVAPGRLRAAVRAPKLLIFIAAAEFRSCYLERNWALLGKGGFRRLIEEGCYFPDCRMAASTFTSTGLATLATGAWPQLHGIIADHWYEPNKRRVVTAGADALEATGLGDQIARNRKSRVFAIGLD